jgi:hypothetical protein
MENNNSGRKKLDIISCYSSSPTHHPLDASFPILILLTMEALPNSPPTMEGLIPTGAPADDTHSSSHVFNSQRCFP